jgi:hypothetical protein
MPYAENGRSGRMAKRKRRGRTGIQEGEGRYEANPSFLFQWLLRASAGIGFMKFS